MLPLRLRFTVRRKTSSLAGLSSCATSSSSRGSACTLFRSPRGRRAQGRARGFDQGEHRFIERGAEGEGSKSCPVP